jgi:signal transduction histidine kinase
MDQLIRFNEGMDQALGESTDRFMQEIGKSRDIAMAVLAHDLGNPLNSIVTSAQIIQKAKGLDRVAFNDFASTIFHSGMRMSKLIENLLDFTRTRFGQPLVVKRESMDLAQVCQQTVDELVVTYPGRTIHWNCTGTLQGFFDTTRISQMFSNLVANAIQHGGKTTPVTVEACAESDQIVFQIHNEGTPISPSKISTIFDLLENPAKESKESNHLGIGLYIARQIIEAHSGKISVTSTAQDGTTFVVRLPRTL